MKTPSKGNKRSETTTLVEARRRSMPYAAEHTQRLRGVRLLTNVDYAVLRVGPGQWRVKSESGRGSYGVLEGPKGWSCECEASIGLWPMNCKHVWAVRVFEKPNPYRSIWETAAMPAKKRARDYKAIDAAHQAEDLEFDDLLWDLLQQVEEPARPLGKAGRPRIPIRTQLFQTVRKVHLGRASRRARGLISLTSCGADRILLDLPNYTIPSKLLNRETTGDILLQLIELAALPLRGLEDGGTVAVDSTGFSTTVRGAYATEKHDPARKHRWVKGHFIIGTKTHAILGVAVTDEHGADCTQFVGLVRNVVAAGFRPAICVADRAYSSREVYNTLADLGIQGYIPFKQNATGQAKGSPMFTKKFIEWMTNRAEFDKKYHARSNIESTNAALKAKLQEGLRSKNPEARFNEVLVKVLAYDIGVLIGQSYANGLDPKSRGRPASAATLTTSSTGPDPEGMAA